MFHADVTFVLALIALVAGAFLVLSAKVHKEISTTPCTVIGFIVVILSIIVILFSGYGMLRSHTMKCNMKCKMMSNMMQQGKRAPCMMMQQMKKNPGMPMMQGKMPMQQMKKPCQMQQQGQMPMKPEMQMHKQMQPGMKPPMMQGMQPKTAPAAS